MEDTETITRAAAMLERPADFGYSGDLPMFETWGFSGISQHRDSDALARSNWEVVTSDLLERFPNDVKIVTSSHWGVGWCDQLAVRVLANDYRPALPVDWRLTDACRAVLEWSDRLAEYPVADDSKFSELEHAELCDYLESIDLECERDGIGYVYADADSATERLARLAFDAFNATRVDDLPVDGRLNDAAINAGILVPDIVTVRETIDAAETRAETLAAYVEDVARGVRTFDECLTLARNI